MKDAIQRHVKSYRRAADLLATLLATLEAADKEIAILKRELENEERVFSIGDRFVVEDAEYLLTKTEPGKALLVNVKTGIRRNDFTPVNPGLFISKKELICMCNMQLTRSWDYQKNKAVYELV